MLGLNREKLRLNLESDLARHERLRSGEDLLDLLALIFISGLVHGCFQFKLLYKYIKMIKSRVPLENGRSFYQPQVV